ncbi:DUF6233 domain-containing protein [Streptomyces sp. NPDC029704]|uniref:DUF6233 domain-containing protein n=1 Tax=Streptomyces sp. NPDC029704 TaxID=3156920 RepID=UPI0033ECACE1
MAHRATRQPYSNAGPRRTVVHHAQCFLSSGPAGPADLTTAQAQEALRQPGAEACTICGAAGLLQQQPTSQG